MFGEARANLIRSRSAEPCSHELQERAQSKGGSSSNTLGPPRSSERVIVFAVNPAVLFFLPGLPFQEHPLLRWSMAESCYWIEAETLLA